MSHYVANQLKAAAELIEKAYGAAQADRVAELRAAANYEDEKAPKEAQIMEALRHAAASYHHPSCKAKGEYSGQPERYCTCHVQKARTVIK